MVVNDHTRSAENWKCVWYLLRLYIYIRVYVDNHSLGQLALASKRTASLVKFASTRPDLPYKLRLTLKAEYYLVIEAYN